MSSPQGQKQNFSPCCQCKFSSIRNSLSQVLKKDHSNLSWLSKPVEQWQEDQEYKIVEEIAQKLCVVNDPAECAVKLAGDRICSQVGEGLPGNPPHSPGAPTPPDIERGTFTKNQLLTVIKKMLLIEDLE